MVNDRHELADAMSASSLCSGDHEAAAGEWAAAVSSWETALATPDRDRAEVRLRWFLEATVVATDTGHSRFRPGVVTFGIGAAVIGTSLVLIASELGNPWRDAFALVAWVFFVVAAGCGLLIAYRRPATTLPPLTSSSIGRAHERAKQMDAASATMPSGPRLPT